jgi:precorrin-6x reductase
VGSLNLKHIYTAPDKYAAHMVKGFLESRDIKVLIKPNPGPEGAFMGKFGAHAPFNPWLVYVREEKVKKAKELLAEIKQ